MLTQDFSIRRINLFLTIFFLLGTIACTEEALTPTTPFSEDLSLGIQDFPEEVSINNWEAFLSAPQDVLEYHRKMELESHGEITPFPNDSKKNPHPKNRGIFLYKGSIKAFEEGGEYVPEVWVSIAGQGTLTYPGASRQGYNYLLGTDKEGPICTELSTTSTNGLSPLDLVYIKKHMAGSQALENVWQLIAADVNHDGILNDVDVHYIQQVILEREPELPDTDNVIFIGLETLKNAQNLLEVGDFSPEMLRQLGRTPACQRGHEDRILIKAGDVNGTAIFH